MRISFIALISLCFVFGGALAHADEEPSLLDRLNAETVELAAAGQAAMVTVRVSGREGPGVLAGTPPRIVVERIVVADAPQVTFRLADGTEGTAERLAGDEELGVAVYALPAEVAARVKGLAPTAAWDVAAGTLAVLCGERPELVLLPGSTGRKNRFQVHTETLGSLLLAPGGKLLGYRVHAVRHTVPRPPPTVFSTQRSRAPLVVGGNLDALRLRYAEAALRRAAALDALRQVNGRTVSTPSAPPPAPAVAFVPGPLIARILKDVEAHGRIRQAYLGVVPGEVESGTGARIVTVIPGSPAQLAGLQPGQIVVRLDRAAVPDPATFTNGLLLRSPGEPIELGILARHQPLRLVLADRATAMRGILSPPTLGLVGMDLTPELAKFLELDEATLGVVIRKAPPPGSRCAKAGLRRGDVIVEGGGEPIRDIGELLAALNGADGAIALTVLRGKERLEIRLELPQAKPAKAAKDPR